MYKSFFGLRASPFNVNPDPRFLLRTQHINEALACLVYGVQTRKGFVLLTGEVGTGKTTLLNKFLEYLRENSTPTAFVFNPRLNVTEFFDYMMADLGLSCDSSNKSKTLQQLNHWLLARYAAGKTAVLIIDEAQNLSYDVLEEIRLLTNLETSTEKLLQIVLSGQPELEEKLKEPRLRQLRQRITLRSRTHPLTREETHSYIGRRLEVAGCNGQPVFSPEAIDTIFRYSRGIPRVINIVCEHALINAFVDQQRPVAARTIDAVAQEFELDIVSPILDGSTGENRGLVEALRTVAELRDEMVKRTANKGDDH